MTLIWVFVAVLFLILEAITVQLVSIWFAIGAFCAVVPAYLDLDLTVQLAVFIGGSILTLILGRPFLMKKRKKEPEKTNLDATVGKIAVVTEPIEPKLGKGRIYVDGLSWQARSTDKVPIEKGREVRIEKITGVTAMVSLVRVN